MEFSILNYSRHKLKKPVGYLIFGIVLFFFFSMIGGKGGAEPLYKTYNVPIWLYFVTSISIFILVIFGIGFAVEPFKPSRKLLIVDNGIIVQEKGKLKEKIFLESIKAIQLNPDYVNDALIQYKRNYFLKISHNDKSTILNIALDSEEREQLENFIASLNLEA